ncbi:hypothetical protein OG765_04690 [Streptomyces sp. NBC_00555]|uniref:DUF7144 family membrane protein n=1 Tax=Streptomyces sp. NBC_00555 TaxID=2903662 RepID=UPI00224D0FB3|nr:hypothetical protein [Streptomyces sp. NBC_00555]MCX5010288.1 hypothetical protein [Streptomyces sp. NBC_00555]
MSQQTPTGGNWNTGPAPGTTPLTEGGGDTISGGVLFASVMLIVTGCLAVFQGIAAIANDDVYFRIGSYVFEFDLTAWGWIHLIIGIIVVLAGIGIFAGSGLARGAGIGLAGLSIILNFMWLPYQPWWAIIIIAIDAIIILALCTSWKKQTG